MGSDTATGPPTSVIGQALFELCNYDAEFGVTPIELPVTSERLWRTIQEARGARLT